MAKKQATHTNGGGSRRQPGRRSQQASADVRQTAGHGAKSQTVRDKAILALLSEKSIAKAAAKCGLSDRTIHRWLTSDAAFKAAYAEARQATFEAGMSCVQALTAKAIDTLDELLDAKDYPNVRLGAARTLAEIGLHQHDADVILQRLDEIEAHQRNDSGSSMLALRPLAPRCGSRLSKCGWFPVGDSNPWRRRLHNVSMTGVDSSRPVWTPVEWQSRAKCSLRPGVARAVAVARFKTPTQLAS